MTGPVTNTSPQDVVLALVRAVSGEIPLNFARGRLLDERVYLHMDTATYRGPASWVVWVQLLRAWGRLCPLRLAVRFAVGTGRTGTCGSAPPLVWHRPPVQPADSGTRCMLRPVPRPSRQNCRHLDQPE